MSALHDQELADVLELERLKRARRVRKACDSTVPSLDPDEIAARVLHTLDSFKMSASGDGLTALSAGRPRRRGKAAPPSPRTPTPLSAATNALRVPGSPPGSPPPIQSARDERLSLTNNGGRPQAQSREARTTPQGG